MIHHRSLACRLVASGLTLGGLVGAAGCGGPSHADVRRPDQTAGNDESKRLAPRDSFEAGKEVPISADTYYASGQFLESQDRLDPAMDQYRKALKLDPKHRQTLYQVGIVLVKQRKLTEAIEAWNKYVTVTDGDATAYANLGFAYELAGRTTDAETAYGKGIRREPTNAVCRVNYGLMLARKERFNEATMQLQTVLSEADVNYNLASVYESLGRKEQAKIAYRKALKLAPNFADAQARLDAMGE
ncbi:MAG: hypothetical protein JWO31_825 [Phycisphaerales bacterium]|nr:hypothetical protein [Phycisphaerales bacterium]